MKFFEMFAEVAELADARDSKSRDGNIMRVRLSLAAQEKNPFLKGFFYFQKDVRIRIYPVVSSAVLLGYVLEYVLNYLLFRS